MRSAERLTRPTRKSLIGRTITDVKMNPFADGRGGTAHDPRITLDDGRVLMFVTEETDVGEYGVALMALRKAKKENK